MLHRIIEENTIARCRYAKRNPPQTNLRRSLFAEILLLQEKHMGVDETAEPQKGTTIAKTTRQGAMLTQNQALYPIRYTFTNIKPYNHAHFTNVICTKVNFFAQKLG